MAMISSSGGIGLVVGPTIGGYLAQENTAHAQGSWRNPRSASPSWQCSNEII